MSALIWDERVITAVVDWQLVVGASSYTIFGSCILGVAMHQIGSVSAHKPPTHTLVPQSVVVAGCGDKVVHGVAPSIGTYPHAFLPPVNHNLNLVHAKENSQIKSK